MRPPSLVPLKAVAPRVLSFDLLDRPGGGERSNERSPLVDALNRNAERLLCQATGRGVIRFVTRTYCPLGSGDCDLVRRTEGRAAPDCPNNRGDVRPPSSNEVDGLRVEVNVGSLAAGVEPRTRVDVRSVLFVRPPRSVLARRVWQRGTHTLSMLEKVMRTTGSDCPPRWPRKGAYFEFGGPVGLVD